MSITPRSTLFALAALAFALAGCGNSDKPDKDKPAAPPAQTPATQGGGQVAPGQIAANPANTPAATAVNATPPAAAAPGPNGRSTVPSLDEWNAAKEIGVRGSTKLNCETKMVREWLRISCRGKNDTGGEPTGVTIKKGGGRGDTFTFAGNKVASLVCPFVDGTDIAADFTWTDKKQELVISWPHGAPMPQLKGEFR